MTAMQMAILLLLQSPYTGCKSKYLETKKQEKHYIAVCKNNNKTPVIIPLKVSYEQKI